MNEFMVRVELFRADSENYTDLHVALERLGLKRTIQGNSQTLKMPPGTYFGASKWSADELRQHVHEISKPFSHPADPSVFVCQSADWSAWLKPA
ncbi:hypothetical protein [Pseudomonas putida]